MCFKVYSLFTTLSNNLFKKCGAEKKRSLILFFAIIENPKCQQISWLKDGAAGAVKIIFVWAFIWNLWPKLYFFGMSCLVTEAVAEGGYPNGVLCFLGFGIVVSPSYLYCSSRWKWMCNPNYFGCRWSSVAFCITVSSEKGEISSQNLMTGQGKLLESSSNSNRH